jgi:hypothetical protein
MHTRYRIPRATKAALLLGGAACGGGGGDDPGSTEGINVSSSRISALAKAVCKQYQECDEYFEDYYESLEQCIAIKKDDLEVPAVTKECADAYLDYVACYSPLSCEELESHDGRCEDAEATFVKACGLDDDDDEYESAIGVSSTKRSAGAGALIRKYRIPR